MGKLKKAIVGLILGLFLSFGVLKVNAANIYSLDDVAIGSTITFNNSLDFSMLSSDTTIVITNYNQYNTSTIIGHNGYASYVKLFINDNGEFGGYISSDPYTAVYFYQSGSWNVNWRYVETNVMLYAYINGQLDNADEEMLAWFNTNTTITYTPAPAQTILNFYNNVGNTLLYTRSVITNSPELMDFNPADPAYVNDPNYTFRGWAFTAGATTAEIVSSTEWTPTASVYNLYEVWSIVSGTYFQISFNANGATSGSVPPTQSLLAGCNYNLPGNTGNLVRSGYTFRGWGATSSSTTPIVSITDLDRDYVVYAIWESGASYSTISFNANGADSGSVPASVTLQVGTTYTLPGNTGNLIKAGYNFVGWATDPNATRGQSTIGVGPVDRVMYAVWVQNTNYSTMNIYINDELIAVYKVYGYIPEGANNGRVMFAFTNTNSDFFKMRLDEIISIFSVSANEEYIWGNYSNDITFAFNGEFVNEIELYYNNALQEIIPREDLDYGEGAFAYHTPYTAGATIDVKIQISSTNNDISNFRNIVGNIFGMVQTFFDLRIGWFTIGGIVAVVFSIAVVFFVFKIAKGGGN